MSVLETIHLRMARGSSEALIRAVHELAAAEHASERLRIYQHDSLAGDLAVHLRHEDDDSDRVARALGRRIASMLKAHGLVDHARWEERETRRG